jgi:hypothetical protein
VRVRSSQLAPAIFGAVVQPRLVSARAACIAVSALIRALSSSEAHSQRNSTDGVPRSRAIPSSCA